MCREAKPCCYQPGFPGAARNCKAQEHNPRGTFVRVRQRGIHSPDPRRSPAKKRAVAARGQGIVWEAIDPHAG